MLVEQALLPRLARPLALALRGPDELVSLGLRTFELWLDSLNPEYLEHALGHTATDVMAALWALLRPAHTQRPHALAAMQLLGKLGARRMAIGLVCAQAAVSDSYTPSLAMFFVPHTLTHTHTFTHRYVQLSHALTHTSTFTLTLFYRPPPPPTPVDAPCRWP